jgi:hypothetical protein
MTALARPAVNVSDRSILSSERILCQYYDRKCSVEKNSGRKPQRSFRQQELIGGKPHVTKYVGYPESKFRWVLKKDSNLFPNHLYVLPFVIHTVHYFST